MYNTRNCIIMADNADEESKVDLERKDCSTEKCQCSIEDKTQSVWSSGYDNTVLDHVKTANNDVDNRNEHTIDSCDCSVVKNKDGDNLWSDLAPEDVLLSIFKKGTKSAGAVPFLCRISQVCRRWYDLAYHPSLWAHVDLSLGWITRDIQGFQVLCQTRLYRTVSINLTAWYGVNNTCLECILENCSMLRCLNLSHCEKISPEWINKLAESGLPLEELNLSGMAPDVSSRKCLCNLLEGIGPRLRKLVLFNCTMDNEFHHVVDAIASNCPLLEHLDLRHLDLTLVTLPFLYINIENLQFGCSNLKVLLMAKSQVRPMAVSEQVKRYAPGFPKLKVFSAPSSINDDTLQRILKTSVDLENFKLSMDLSLDVMYTQLPLLSLRELHVHRARPSQLHIAWHQTLEVLDFSWIKLAGHSGLENKMKTIFDPAGPKFEVLHSLQLCGAPIKVNNLRAIFECCPKLNDLNLYFCTMLPSGWSDNYSGPQIKILKHVMLGLPTVPGDPNVT